MNTNRIVWYITEYFIDVNREEEVNAEVDKFFMENVYAELMAKERGNFGLWDVVPSAFETIQKREAKFTLSTGAKERGAGAQALLLLVVQCGFNIRDVKGKESNELLPFWNEVKTEESWNAGVHAFGALLVGCQDARVSMSIPNRDILCNYLTHGCPCCFTSLFVVCWKQAKLSIMDGTLAIISF